MLRSARSLAAQDFVECPPAVGMAINLNEADPWSEQRLPKRPRHRIFIAGVVTIRELSGRHAGIVMITQRLQDELGQQVFHSGKRIPHRRTTANQIPIARRGYAGLSGALGSSFGNGSIVARPNFL